MCFPIRHSLHRKPSDAKGFYAVYAALIVIAAVIVLSPNAPLGLLTNAVQTLAGVLLPSATVFLLLLCNDRSVLGPWTNTRAMNLFTGAVIATLVMLSVILTVSVLFPAQTNETIILSILGAGALIATFATLASGILKRPEPTAQVAVLARATWRMPALAELPPANLSTASRWWMGALRVYLIIAGGLVLVRIVTLALSS